eukprot:c14697_g1_i1.p1 GENE.c14697_g1_i1~~c14697_g1_i1.p1  ORF type:complete len:321 (+),score=54.93 c14697_g1_i1:121-1083(+)
MGSGVDRSAGRHVASLVAVILFVATVVGAVEYCSQRCPLRAAQLIGKTSYKYRSDQLIFLNVYSTTTSYGNWTNTTGSSVYAEPEEPEITITNRTMRAPFFTRVDQFSQLMLKGSGVLYNRNATAEVYLSIGQGANMVKSSSRRFSDGENYVGYFSAVVNMDAGRVVSIAWDEGCGSCSDDLCIDRNCANEYPSSQVCLLDECNIKVYVAWVGTTLKNRQCLSGGYLPSNFRRFSLGNVRRTASQLSGDAVSNIRDSAGSNQASTSGGGTSSGSSAGNPADEQDVMGRGNPTSTGASDHERRMAREATVVYPTHLEQGSE